jgi:methyltransferase
MIVWLVVFGTMLVEALRSARNERAQRMRGGLEPSGDVYNQMRLAYPAAFAAMLLEGTLRHVGHITFAAGAALFVVAKGIKWWAILSLGPAWTFRVIVVPSAPLVTRGPYRFVRHPNYLGVVGELAGVALMTGAVVSGPIAVAGFSLLLSRRIAVEERALERAASRRGEDDV